jgi:hypothetical protein
VPQLEWVHGPLLVLSTAWQHTGAAYSTGKSKYVSGKGSSRRVKCHHSLGMPLKPCLSGEGDVIRAGQSLDATWWSEDCQSYLGSATGQEMYPRDHPRHISISTCPRLVVSL